MCDKLNMPVIDGYDVVLGYAHMIRPTQSEPQPVCIHRRTVHNLL